MNKKTISNIFVAVAICLAFMQQTLWVSIGLMIAAIVICGEEKTTKRIAQCLALVLVVSVIKYTLGFILGAFDNYNYSFVNHTEAGYNYYKFLLVFNKYMGFVANLFIAVFAVLGAINFSRDKEMPLFGGLVEKIAGLGSKATKNKDAKTEEETQNTDDAE